MQGINYYAVSKTTRIAFEDYTRMRTEVHSGHAPVAPWALDDEKVRKVVAYRIAITAIEPNVPTTLEELRKLEPRYVAVISRGANTQLHLEKVAQFGGPIAYYTSLIYRRFRLRMDSPALARHYGCSPASMRQTINRLCRIARALFPNAEDHLPWHHTSGRRAIPTLGFRVQPQTYRTRTCPKAYAEPKRCYKPHPPRHKFDWEKAQDLRLAGLTLRAIAEQVGGVNVSSVFHALRKMGEQKCN